MTCVKARTNASERGEWASAATMRAGSAAFTQVALRQLWAKWGYSEAEAEGVDDRAARAAIERRPSVRPLAVAAHLKRRL
jgi:hypothetical protein